VDACAGVLSRRMCQVSLFSGIGLSSRHGLDARPAKTAASKPLLCLTLIISVPRDTRCNCRD
jgi:hypothetical protein